MCDSSSSRACTTTRAGVATSASPAVAPFDSLSPIGEATSASLQTKMRTDCKRKCKPSANRLRLLHRDAKTLKVVSIKARDQNKKEPAIGSDLDSALKQKSSKQQKVLRYLLSAAWRLERKQRSHPLWRVTVLPHFSATFSATFQQFQSFPSDRKWFTHQDGCAVLLLLLPQCPVALSCGPAGGTGEPKRQAGRQAATTSGRDVAIGLASRNTTPRRGEGLGLRVSRAIVRRRKRHNKIINDLPYFFFF